MDEQKGVLTYVCRSVKGLRFLGQCQPLEGAMVPCAATPGRQLRIASLRCGELRKQHG